jgi:hypothetical protein
MNDDPYAHLDAAYLMGALDPEERAAYEAHLADCADCRAAVERGRPVLAALAVGDESMLDGTDEPVPPMPELLLPALLARARRDQRRRRLGAGALGGVAAACAIVIAVLIGTSGHSADLVQRAMARVHDSPVIATAALRPTNWGTQIEITCRYRPGSGSLAGYRYALVARGTDGATYQLGSWKLSPGQPMHFTAGTALASSQIAAIVITDSDGTRLLELTNAAS